MKACLLGTSHHTQALLNASLYTWHWATMAFTCSLIHSSIHSCIPYPFTHLSSKTQQSLKELGLCKVCGMDTAP